MVVGITRRVPLPLPLSPPFASDARQHLRRRQSLLQRNYRRKMMLSKSKMVLLLPFLFFSYSMMATMMNIVTLRTSTTTRMRTETDTGTGTGTGGYIGGGSRVNTGSSGMILPPVAGFSILSSSTTTTSSWKTRVSHCRNDHHLFTSSNNGSWKATTRIGTATTTSRRRRESKTNTDLKAATTSSSTTSSSSSSLSSSNDDNKNGSAFIIKRWMVRILTGHKLSSSSSSTTSSSSSSLQRPKWLSPSSKLSKVLPTWIFHLRPSVQLVATLVLYLIHTAFLTQGAIPLPFQLIPNDRGNFQSIGLDSLAGMATLSFYQYLRRQPSNFFDLKLKKASKQKTTEPLAAGDINNNSNKTTTTKTTTTTTTTTTTSIIKASYLPDLLSTPNVKNMPWKNIWKSKYSQLSSFTALLALFRAYFFTGRFSLFWEDKLYEIATHIPWMTVPMHRSLCVLLGHASWIVIGALILRWIPSPSPFFQQPTSQWFTSQYRNKNVVYDDNDDNDDDDDANLNGNANANGEDKTPEQLPLLSQQQSIQHRHPQWIWWAIGGYVVSSWFFNIADFLNSYIFPLSILEQAQENSVVAKLINPEGRDWLASLVGYIAPCITAPWWEEVLYRGFLLPTLVLQMKYPLALFTSGVLFSIHHQSELAFLPLCVLGWTWAIVYTKSKNLWTTILIHSMWNSRIFLGSWFGL